MLVVYLISTNLDMKKLDKVILVLFSVIIFLQSILIIFLIFGWLDMNVVGHFFELTLTKSETSKIVLSFTVVCFLGAIKGIFFESSNKSKKTNGVLMQNDNGKLLISKTTIENIVITVIREFKNVEDISVLTDNDALGNLIINVNISVGKDVIIKELTVNIQNRIKEALKKTSDLDVKEVNVKIKNLLSEGKKKEINREN